MIRVRLHQAFRSVPHRLTRSAVYTNIQTSFSSPQIKGSDQKAYPYWPDTARCRPGVAMAAPFLLFLLLSGCNAFEPVKRSGWAYKGHEYVNCPDRKMIKMCEKAGPYMICECALR